MVVVKVGKVIFITHLSNSFIKVIKNQPTNANFKEILAIHTIYEISFSRTLSPCQVLAARVFCRQG